MLKRYQVFISSTFEDLEPARQQVSMALLRANCFPAGMELFPAADTEQFEFIKEVIRESDYYVVISAGKYGSIHPETGLSYTEMEYDYAKSIGIPIIRLLHKDPFSLLLGNQIDQDPDKQKKLASFRNKMLDGSLVNFWSTHEELGLNVIVNLMNAQARFPAKGWVRTAEQAETVGINSFIEADGTIPGYERLEDLPIPLIRLTSKGLVKSFSQRASDLIGNDLKLNTHLSNFVEGTNQPFLDWFTDVANGKPAQKSEFFRLAQTDKEVFIKVTLNRIIKRDRVSLIAVLNDATELKSLEAEFVQSQKMQAIGQLAGGVAHDFNNLLTVISGHCDLLLLRHDQGDENYGDLVQINQNANRAAALVGQLLAFSRKQTLRPEALDLRDTLADLTHLLNRLVGEKVTLVLSHDPVLKSIRADKRQLEQVLMNLVVNARDAMPGGGEIKIDTKSVSLSEPLVRDRVSVPIGDYVTVQVSDNGTGIPENQLQRIFEPFFTTKSKGEGTGLGLSTAYGIIKQTGGYIFADSTLGSGTCFTMYFQVLEVQQSKMIPVSLVPWRDAPKKRDGTVLLVEHEPQVRGFASRVLRLRGCNVVEADSGEAALTILKDKNCTIDVIVTELILPGQDGPDWVRKALNLGKNFGVIFMSGYAEDSLAESWHEIPNSMFLPKPFSVDELTGKVNRLLSLAT